MAKLNLPPKARSFSKVYAATGNARLAAIQAGYKHEQAAYELLQRPAVADEVRKIQTQRLITEALPIAVATLIEVMTDKNQRGSARNMAAKIVIDRTLGEKGGADGKEAHELTGSELAAAIEQLEREAAARAKPVNQGVFD